MVSLSLSLKLIIRGSICYFMIRYPSNHYHLSLLKCHLVLGEQDVFLHWPSLTTM